MRISNMYILLSLTENLVPRSIWKIYKELPELLQIMITLDCNNKSSKNIQYSMVHQAKINWTHHKICPGMISMMTLMLLHLKLLLKFQWIIFSRVKQIITKQRKKERNQNRSGRMFKIKCQNIWWNLSLLHSTNFSDPVLKIKARLTMLTILLQIT